MAISYVNVATWTNATSATTFTFNKPSGIQNDDILIAFVCASDGGGNPGLTGWTHIYDGIGNFGGDETFSAAYWRRVDGTEPSSWTSGTFSGTQVTSNTIVVAYRGVHPTDPIVVSDASFPGGMGTTPLTDNPAFTVEDAGGWIVNFMGYRSSASSTTSSHNMGFTERSDVSAGASSQFETVALYDSNGQYETLGNVFCQVASTQTAVSGGTWTAQLRPADYFPAPVSPRFRGITAAESTGANLTHSSMPTHRAGDYLLWSTTMAKQDGQSISPTVDNGWVKLDEFTNADPLQIVVWGKYATSSSEAAPTITLNGSGTGRRGILSHMSSWRYVDAPTVTSTGGTTGSSLATPSVTTPSDNCAVVRTLGVRDSAAVTHSWPTSAELGEETVPGGGSSFSADDITQSVAYIARPTAGSTGTESVSISSSVEDWGAVTVALSNSFRSATDTGSGVDAYVKTLLTNPADTGSGADSGTKEVAGPNPATDTGTGTDAAGTQTIGGTNDTGTGTEGQAVRVVAADTGSGADTSGVRPGGVDTGSGTDVAGTVRVAGAADTGSGADTAATTATTPVATDTSSGADTATVRISGTDTGSGAEAVNSIFDIDSASAADVAVGVRVSGAVDIGSGADTAVATNTAIVSDTSSSSELASVLISGAGDSAEGSDTVLGFGTDDAVGADDSTVKVSGAADTGSGTDSAFASNSASDNDTGTGTEASTLRSVGADIASGTESAALVVGLGADTGTGTDTATSSATIPGGDSGSGADGQSVALNAADTGSGLDNAILQIYIDAEDTGSGADTAVAASTIAGADAFAGADTAAVIVQSPDSLALADAGTLRISGTDTGTDVENGAITATISGAADTGSIIDLGSIAIPATSDTGAWFESGMMFVTFGPVFGPRAVRIGAEERVVTVLTESRTRTMDSEVRLFIITKDLTTTRLQDPDYEQSTESRHLKVKAEVREYAAEVDSDE